MIFIRLIKRNPVVQESLGDHVLPDSWQQFGKTVEAIRGRYKEEAMRTAKRWATAGCVLMAFLVLGSTLSTAAPAMAAPTTGHVSAIVTAPLGTRTAVLRPYMNLHQWYSIDYEDDGTFGEFTVAIYATNNGYDAEVYHKFGANNLVDFNLTTSTGVYGDTGDFWIAAGQTKTYFFAVGLKSWAWVDLYWRKNKVGPSGPYFDVLPSPTYTSS